MKTIYLSICLLLLVYGCSQGSKEKGLKDLPTKELSLIEVKDTLSLYPLFDSVINFEKKCDNYEDSTFFAVDIYQNDIVFHSGLDIQPILHIHTIGYFIYKNHYFFLGTPNDVLFSVTNRKKKFLYEENNEPFKDDSGSVTKFIFKNKKYILTGRSSFCGDDVPFEYENEN